MSLASTRGDMLCQRATPAALTSEVSASTEGQCCAGTTLQVRQRSHCTHWSVSGSGAAAAGAAPEALLFGVGEPASDLPPSSADGISCGAMQSALQDPMHGVLTPERSPRLCVSAVVTAHCCGLRKSSLAFHILT